MSLYLNFSLEYLKKCSKAWYEIACIRCYIVQHTYLLTFFVAAIEKFCKKRKICRCGNYSRAETNQGRKLSYRPQGQSE